MRIGDLSQATATPVETIRYYEREGLLPAPARTSGNYRTYDDTHRERLQFIRHCRGLDLSLDEVRELLRLRDAPDGCVHANGVLDAHIGHVTRRIRELRVLEKQLKDLRRRCGEETPDQPCGILAGLTEGAQEPPVDPSARRVPAHLRSVHGH